MRPSTEALALGSIAALVLLLSCRKPGRAPAIWVSAGEGVTCFGMKDGAVRCASSDPSHPALFGHGSDEHRSIEELRGHRLLVLGPRGLCSTPPAGGAPRCVGDTEGLSTEAAPDEACRGKARAIPALGAAVQIACGDAHACGRMANGTVACWGDLGVEAARAVPYPGLFGVIQIASSRRAVYAVTRDGGVYGWGDGVVPAQRVTIGKIRVPTPIFLRP